MRVSVIVPFVPALGYNEFQVKVQTNIPLSTLTTMKIGGNASYVAEAHTPEELRQVYLNAKKLRQPVYIVGGGSNLIAHDDGFSGAILLNKIPGIEVLADDNDSTTLKAGAGEIWDEFVEHTVTMNLSGVEAMSGIPGTVGAAPVQNIGAYGQELADTFMSLEAYDIHNDTFVSLSAEDCAFSYRDSIFRSSASGRYAIVSVTVKLYKTPPQPPFYESLQRYFESNGVTDYTVAAVRAAVREIRSTKLPDPSMLPNAGSFFKNAIIERWTADPLIEQYPDMPTYAMADNKVKVPAGWLIEQCDLKGQILHGMKIHDQNAVVLINQSAERYSDLATAREEIVSAVRTKFQIELQQEPIELPAR